MPIEDLLARWMSFGWDAKIIKGHDEVELGSTIADIDFANDVPSVIISENVKGKGVSFIEGHGVWHHKVPDQTEMHEIKNELGIL